jgi:hypothetical protein
MRRVRSPFIEQLEALQALHLGGYRCSNSKILAQLHANSKRLKGDPEIIRIDPDSSGGSWNSQSFMLGM